MKTAMVRDGIYYLIGFLGAGAVVASLIGPGPAAPLFLIGLFCGWFFRDPERPIPAGPVAVSPADGLVDRVVDEPGRRTRISIFLNIFDVHVNRSPVGGVIAKIRYKQGAFLDARHEKASELNESNEFTVVSADGTVVIFRQITGLIARRIVCYKKEGDTVQTGERVGLIKFGSRVDVIFGPEWRVEVSPGTRLSAGSSIIARRADQILTADVLAQVIVKEPVLCQT
jgi:phosphatidylserine decarboxylase